METVIMYANLKYVGLLIIVGHIYINKNMQQQNIHIWLI